MDPIEASTTFATLVGLICNWNQERGSQATNRFQDFMLWLSNHHFEGLRTRIFESEELQREIGVLLQQDISVLNSKLDTIAGAISAVANKIENLSQIGHVMKTDTNALSDQASEILKYFDQIGASRMIVFDHSPTCTFLPQKLQISVTDARFLETDVSALKSLGFIKLVDHNKSGNPIFAITRAGSAFAAKLPDLPLP